MKQQTIRHTIRKAAQICKRVKWGRLTVMVLSLFGVVFLANTVIGAVAGAGDTAEPSASAAKAAESVERLEIAPRYELTDEERWVVASVVTAEAGAEPYAGKMAVAQCILNACERDGIRPTEAVISYKYAKARPEPTAEALRAVEAVFDFGQVATTAPIMYFYAPALVYSEWHESQEYVMTINGHKFFAEKAQ